MEAKDRLTFLSDTSGEFGTNTAKYKNPAEHYCLMVQKLAEYENFMKENGFKDIKQLKKDFKETAEALNLCLKNLYSESVVGVDSAYFSDAIEAICKKQEKEPNFEIDNNYLFEIINKIF